MFSLKCKKFIQYVVGAYFLSILTLPCHSQVGRTPANFVPDDDEIIVPIIVEKNFIDEFHEKHADQFQVARKRLQFWLQQEQYAKDYGLEDSGVVDTPTEDEKVKFLNRNYLRFLSKDVERSTNSNLRDTLEDWTTDDEIDAISAVELHEKVIVHAKKKNGDKIIKEEKSVKVGKDTFKFGFQPRLEMGMVKFTIKSKYFNARAWVGVNGNQELKLERRFKSTNTKAMVNYYIDEERALAVIDQRIANHFYLRLTHTKEFNPELSASEEIVPENNIVQLRFNMGF